MQWQRRLTLEQGSIIDCSVRAEFLFRKGVRESLPDPRMTGERRETRTPDLRHSISALRTAAASTPSTSHTELNEKTSVRYCPLPSRRLLSVFCVCPILRCRPPGQRDIRVHPEVRPASGVLLRKDPRSNFFRRRSKRQYLVESKRFYPRRS